MTAAARHRGMSQYHETPLQHESLGPFHCRVAYGRSSDAQQSDSVGQDYLHTAHDEQTLAFSICDGVGQSFFGELAASMLGQALIEWLMDGFPVSDDPDTVATALRAHLVDLTDPATQRVLTRPLPDSLDPIIVEVLEAKRQAGSEATFVCGRIDLPRDDLPDGRLVVAWGGDSMLRLWGPDGEWVDGLRGTFNLEDRWSTRDGVLGAGPHVVISPVRERLTVLEAYSDGLAVLDQFPEPPSSFAVADLLERNSYSPTSDDIAFIEVRLDGPAADHEQPPLPAPAGLRADADGDVLCVQWERTANGTHYEIEARNGTAAYWTTPETTWRSELSAPGSHHIRVRAMRGAEPGHWSEPIQVEIEVPLPPPLPPSPLRRRGTPIAAGIAAVVALGVLLAAMNLLATGDSGQTGPVAEVAATAKPQATAVIAATAAITTAPAVTTVAAAPPATAPVTAVAIVTSQPPTTQPPVPTTLSPSTPVVAVSAPRSAPVPLASPYWVRNHRPAALWSDAVNGPTTVAFGTSTGLRCVFRVMLPPDHNRLFVWNPWSRNYAWIEEADVEPVPEPARVQAPNPPDQNCTTEIYEG